MQSRSILVSGGGVAGLTAALALSKRGYRIDLYEAAPKFDVVGAGIQLSPNAMLVLDDLGVAKTVRLTATQPDGIQVRSAHTNSVTTTIPLGSDAIARYGMPYVCVHRAELHQALEIACRKDPDISIHMNCRVSDAAVHENGVSMLVSHDGEVSTCRGKALIVADGARSPLRDQMPNTGELSHSGFEAWRAMIPADNLPSWVSMDFTQLIMGSDAHAVLYPVNAGRYLNVVICIRTENTDLTNVHTGSTESLRSRLQDWSAEFQALADQADDWSLWPILERKQTCLWNGGPVALIGDAAHAMPPFAAQGAAMAIEDAEVLANCMESHGTSQEAFETYVSRRTGRLEKIRKLARSNGLIYHMGWPFSAARDFGMSMIPAKRLLERQSWVYDWKAAD